MPPKGTSKFKDIPALKARIVEHIRLGHYLAEICGKDGLPSRTTVLDWQDGDEVFRAQCARAREQSGEIHEQAIADISSDVLRKKVEPDAARVAINALTWLAKVRAPRQYGDKLDVAHSGGVTFTNATHDDKL